MRLALLGPPGVGKGTQAERLAEHLGVRHVSTGEMFRDAVARGSDDGLKAKKYLDGGGLVPDEIVTDILAERIGREDCARGFVLDGFPRTLPQARSLDAILQKRGMSLDAVVYYAAPEEVTVERLSGRRMCRKCGANFHVKFHPPARDGICDACGGELYTRSDDVPATIRERLRVYMQSTQQLIEYYRSQGTLIEVAAADGPDEVERATLASLAGKRER